MRVYTGHFRTKSHTLVNDMGALLNCTPTLHMNEQNLLSEAVRINSAKYHSLTERYHSVQKDLKDILDSDADKERYHKARQEYLSALEDYIIASVENHQACQENNGAFASHLNVFDKYRYIKVGALNNLLQELRGKGHSLYKNSLKIIDITNTMNRAVDVFKNMTNQLLDSKTVGRVLGDSEREVMENSHNWYLERRSVLIAENEAIINKCREQEGIREFLALDENNLVSCPIMQEVMEYYTRTCNHWDVARIKNDEAYENNTRLYEENRLAFQNFKMSLLLCQNIQRSGLKAEVDTSEAESHCSICISEMKQGQYIIKWIPCEHRFHKNCIVQWISEETTCPNCREPLTERV